MNPKNPKKSNFNAYQKDALYFIDCMKNETENEAIQEQLDKISEELEAIRWKE